MDNYTKSNSIEIIPKCKLSVATKKQFVISREKHQTTNSELQSVANSICDDLKISRVYIYTLEEYKTILKSMVNLKIRISYLKNALLT